MSEENVEEFATDTDEDLVDELSGDEYADDDSDDISDEDSGEVEDGSVTSTVFDSADEGVSDYLDVVSTDSALALFALPTTGEPRVDDALGRLGDLESLPVHEHVEVFEDVQRRLHDTLADLAGS
jgi:hypothetical protein